MTEVSKSAILTRAQEVIDETVANANDEGRIGGIFRDIADSFKHNDDNFNVVYVDNHGAVGDGVTDDTVAIQAAFTAAATDSVIAFGAGKTYLISNELTINDAVTLNGNRSVIKRANELVTTLSAVALDNATTLTVADATGFAVGDEVALLDVTGTFSGKGDSEIGWPFPTITDITSNVLTLDAGISLPDSGNLATEYPTGAKVLKQYVMMNPNGNDTDPDRGFTFNELYFDGNAANNLSTHSWRAQRGIELGTPSGCLIHGCKFYEMPSETMFPSNDWIISHCHFYDCYGSGSHASVGSRTIYVGNNYENMSRATIEVNEHGEAAITFSASAQDQIIIGNNFENLQGAVFGDWTTPDYRTVISGNTVRGARYLFSGRSAQGFNQGLVMTGNIFEDVDSFYISDGGGSDISTGQGNKEIIITGNHFTNCRGLFEHCSNVVIANNVFKAEEGYTWEDYGFPALSTYNAFLNFNNCANVHITGNQFDNRQETEDAKLYCGINAYNTGGAFKFVKSDASTDTKYAYAPRNFSINNNRFQGLRRMVRTHQGTSDSYSPNSHTWTTYGNTIKGNTFVGRADASSDNHALITSPGWVVQNNDLYGNSTWAMGVQVVCVTDNTIPATIFTGNTIIGFTVSITVATAADSGSGYGFGSIVKDNMVDGIVTDNSGGNSTVSGNTTIVAGSPLLQNVGEDSGFY